jgi:hypothetical protein
MVKITAVLPSGALAATMRTGVKRAGRASGVA